MRTEHVSLYRACIRFYIACMEILNGIIIVVISQAAHLQLEMRTEHDHHHGDLFISV